MPSLRKRREGAQKSVTVLTPVTLCHVCVLLPADTQSLTVNCALQAQHKDAVTSHTVEGI